MRTTYQPGIPARPVHVRIGAAVLDGDLALPAGASALVLFVHGSGSGRHSPRNRLVAAELNRAGLGTLLFDLLTPQEEAVDLQTGELRFDIGLLANRVVGTADWLDREPGLGRLPLGLFGASTGAAAALVAATERPNRVAAIVSRGGRPDLAANALERVRSPTLLIVGGDDLQVLELNEQALARLTCERDLRVVPGASHLFEEPGTLEQVARLTSDWFGRHLPKAGGPQVA